MNEYPYSITQPEGKYPRPATEEELHALFENTKFAARYYPGEEMFTGACRQINELPTKEKLLQSISSNMTLRKSFFVKVYGYEISYPDYANKVIKMLEDAGCSKARTYYEMIIKEREEYLYEKVKPIAEWVRNQISTEFEKITIKTDKRGDELRKARIVQNLHQKSDRELLNLLQSMK